MKKILFSTCLTVASAIALAGPGHDHAEETRAVDSPAAPRVVMEADLFEAVAVLKGHTLEIFIDHAATNVPVENAELAILLNGEKVPLELHDVGEFDAVLTDSLKEKNLDLALRITAGDQSELLTGRLVLDDHEHAGGHEQGHDHVHGGEAHSHLLEYLAIAGAALLGLLTITWLVRRRRKGVN